eukprot:scaffold18321_cov28-Tisochrysis_lutea.AAC.3
MAASVAVVRAGRAAMSRSCQFASSSSSVAPRFAMVYSSRTGASPTIFAISSVKRFVRSLSPSRLRQAADPIAVPTSPRAGTLTSTFRECASRQNVSGAPSTARRFARVEVSRMSSSAAMMATCSRLDDESGNESTYIRPSAVSGSCMTRRAEARCPMEPSTRTAARRTSRDAVDFARRIGTSWGTNLHGGGQGRVTGTSKRFDYSLVEGDLIGGTVSSGCSNRLQNGAKQLVFALGHGANERSEADKSGGREPNVDLCVVVWRRLVDQSSRDGLVVSRLRLQRL